MTRRRIAAGLGLVLALLVVLAFAVEIDSPELGNKVLARVGAATGARVSAGAFRLSVAKGLVLRGVKAEKDDPTARLTAEMAEIRVVPLLLPLLRGKVEVARVRVVSPRVVMEQKKGRARPEKAAAAPAAAALHVARLTIEDAAIELRSPGAVPVKVSGLSLDLADLALAGAGLSGLSGQGTLSVASIAAATTVSDVASRFHVANGELRTDSLTFHTPEGRFEGSVEARLDRPEPSYAVKLDGKPLDVNAAAGNPPGGSFGPGLLTLAGKGVGSDPLALAGAGVFRLAGGTLPGTEPLRRLEQALGRTRIVGARYEPAETPYRIERGRVTFDRFVLKSGDFELDLRGWADVDQRVDVDAVVRVPRGKLDLPGVSGAVLDACTEEDGRVAVPVRVSGTRPDLAVRPDLQALLSRAGKKSLGEKVKGFFGRIRR